MTETQKVPPMDSTVEFAFTEATRGTNQADDPGLVKMWRNVALMAWRRGYESGRRDTLLLEQGSTKSSRRA